MQIVNVNSLEDVIISNLDIAIGYFDGCHLGHQKLLSNIKACVTFNNHLYKKPIFTLDQRLAFLKDYGVELVYVLDVNYFKDVEATEFIKFLNNPKKVVVGYDFKFGYKALGDVELLKKHVNTNLVEEYQINGVRVSSTLLKKYFSNGDIKNVNLFLGRNYLVYGQVIVDQRLGSTIGFPTANIMLTNSYLKYGVYVTNTKINGIIYKSITNVGVRPTVKDNSLKIETHILDFNQNIYGSYICVEFLDFIRSEIKFDSIDQLVLQIKKDVKKVKDGYGS